MPLTWSDAFGLCPGGTARNFPSLNSQDSASRGLYTSDQDDALDPPPTGCWGFTGQGGNCTFSIDGGGIFSCYDFPDGGLGLRGGGDSNCWYSDGFCDGSKREEGGYYLCPIWYCPLWIPSMDPEWSDEFGGGGGGGSDESPTDKKKPKCFADLKFNPAGHGAPPGATHSFWYVQNSAGDQYIVTAGPTNGSRQGGNYGALNVWPIQVDDTTKDSYSNKSTDTTAWSTQNAPANDKTDYCDAVAKLLAAAKAWPNNSIPWNPLGPNSNSAARTLGGIAGFAPPAPPGSIGWDVPIVPGRH